MAGLYYFRARAVDRGIPSWRLWTNTGATVFRHVAWSPALPLALRSGQTMADGTLGSVRVYVPEPIQRVLLALDTAVGARFGLLVLLNGAVLHTGSAGLLRLTTLAALGGDPRSLRALAEHLAR